MVERTPVTSDPFPHFPFGIPFQMQLLRLICHDPIVADLCSKHVEPKYFQNEALAWAFDYIQRYREQYGCSPSLDVIRNEARKLDRGAAAQYEATLAKTQETQLRDIDYLKDETVEFIRRNLFARAHAQASVLYNNRKETDAYDHMRREMAKLDHVQFRLPERSFFFEEFRDRVVERQSHSPEEYNVGTGLATLDRILEGGLGLGEMGAWIADAKTGKTTMLLNHGVAAVRLHQKRVLHINLEGHLAQINGRYDAAFSGHLYSAVKFGRIDEAEFARMQEEYAYYRSLMVIRSFSETWDTNIYHVENELKELELNFGWKPSLLIIDYGDLLKPREKTLRTEREKQKAAYQDMKSLANRGYALWTASQSQRPDGDTNTPRVVKRGDIADAYDKIRIVDFAGSLNSTDDERADGIMRIYAELYRDNRADQLWTVRSDFQRMMIYEDDAARSPHATTEAKPQRLGYSVQQVGAKL